jgi:hypothetical protein
MMKATMSAAVLAVVLALAGARSTLIQDIK